MPRVGNSTLSRSRSTRFKLPETACALITPMLSLRRELSAST